MPLSTFSEEDQQFLTEFLSTNGPGREVRHVRAGDVLFNKGDKVLRVVYLVKGEIKVNAMQGGRTALHETICPHNWVAECAVSGYAYHRYTGIATIDSEIVVFPLATFDELLKEHPALNTLYLHGTTRHLDALHDIVDDYIFNDAATRLANAFYRMVAGRKAEVLQIERTQDQLAETIGVSRATINSILKAFSDANIVKKKKKEVYLIHRVQLEKYLGIEPQTSKLENTDEVNARKNHRR